MESPRRKSGLPLRWFWPFPVICLTVVGILGMLLLADIATRLSYPPRAADRFQGNDAYWLPWLHSRLIKATSQTAVERLSVDQFLQTHCTKLASEHQPLVHEYLRRWRKSGVDASALEKWPGHAYIYKGQLYLGPQLERGRLMPTYLHMINALMQHVDLPDMDLPLNAADEPLAQDDQPPVPLMSFCRPRSMIDILIPNTIEGDIYPPPSAAKEGAVSGELAATLVANAPRRAAAGLLSGPGDPRIPKAVWRGTVMQAYRGIQKGRWALLEVGRTQPDVMDSGSIDWDEKMYGDELGRKKEHLSFKEQMEMYKYMVWVPGNCASVRLAKELAADTLVLKLESEEYEWYYPLLKPHEHYIPIWVDTTAGLNSTASSVGIAEAVRWAEKHPHAVRRIVEAANRFARRHLSVNGRECYFTRLLQQWHALLLETGLQPPPGSEIYVPH